MPPKSPSYRPRHSTPYERKPDGRPTVNGLQPSYRHYYYSRLLKAMWRGLAWSTTNALTADHKAAHGWKAFRVRGSVAALLEHLAENHRGLDGIDRDIALNEVANALFAAGLEALLKDPAWSGATRPSPAHLEHNKQPITGYSFR
ncbi:MAG: hypothetical protein Q7J44_14835 [Pseudotabrizicola sp.]|uniref:hypothetical protein n=1 Tax=Pseudotabrizicola sp. TaxID=2939647 RepID=UPI002722D345|nr:hypothetical protein [Pseudotabrizicola sp.]MDO9639812.1 hypothetical protein [Pseudotabrizicola sp.]